MIGPCGSGKSFIAKELSKKYNIKGYELDNLVWDRSAENLRFPIEVREAKLDEILSMDSWIVEGAQYSWGTESFKKADIIFILKPNKLTRNYRVVRRFFRTRIGLEKWKYKQSFKNLYQMIFEWNRGYDQEGFSTILELTDEFADKRIIISNNKKIIVHIEEHFSS
ncbi:adenylate kinase family enzyme [Paenibacillus wynnii]|nr:adenylate kinase family enzyme [Paenibacillus wynnii]